MELQTNGDRTCGILTTPDERNNHGPCEKGADGTPQWKRGAICQERGSTHLWRRASSEETRRPSLITNRAGARPSHRRQAKPALRHPRERERSVHPPTPILPGWLKRVARLRWMPVLRPVGYT